MNAHLTQVLTGITSVTGLAIPGPNASAVQTIPRHRPGAVEVAQCQGFLFLAEAGPLLMRSQVGRSCAGPRGSLSLTLPLSHGERGF
jgi:hypothetical protein